MWKPSRLQWVVIWLGAILAFVLVFTGVAEQGRAFSNSGLFYLSAAGVGFATSLVLWMLATRR